MPKPKYAYHEVILSGRPVMMVEGLDYRELTEDFRDHWHQAARRKGLRLATKLVHEPVPGVIMQAYIPENGRPVLPDPPDSVQDGGTKRHLVCSAAHCHNYLAPSEMKYRQCAEHRD